MSAKHSQVAHRKRSAVSHTQPLYSTLVQGNRPALYEVIRPLIQRFAEIDADFDIVLGEKYPYSRDEALRRVQVHQSEWEVKNRRREGNV